MASIVTVAAHEVVRATYPRPVTESDEIGMAVGKAIDETLAHFSWEARDARRTSLAAMNRRAADVLDRELADADLRLAPTERDRQLEQIAGVLGAFRKSEVMGLGRPRSRLVLINEHVGVYTQPDYWDGRERFYEMKSYRALPMPPDVELQMRLFQLGFPDFQAYLACFDRHAAPVTVTIERIPSIEERVAREVLSIALRVGTEHGVAKVLEYVDAPTVRYNVSA